MKDEADRIRGMDCDHCENFDAGEIFWTSKWSE